MVDALGELLDDPLDLGHCLAGAEARGRLAPQVPGGDAIEALQLRRAVSPLSLGYGREGHHISPLVAHIPRPEVRRQHPVGGLALHIDTLQPALVEEVVDVARSPGHREQLVDRRQRDTQRLGLLVVDGQLVAGVVRQAVGPDAG